MCFIYFPRIEQTTCTCIVPLVDGGQYSNGYYKEKWNVVNLHGDVLLNLTNMFCGYKEDRLYSFIPYVGAGFVHTGKGPAASPVTGLP